MEVNVKNVIVDIASRWQSALAEEAVNDRMNILGVTVSPDVKNYEDLCAYNMEAIRSVSDVDLYKGAERPLLNNEYVRGKECVHMETSYKFSDINRVDFILDCAENIQNLEIICLGPLSNIALAIMLDSETMKKVKRIYVAGGALLGYGVETPTSEHNILSDAEAAKTVFSSEIPITLVPPHICKNVAKSTFNIVAGGKYGFIDAFIDVDTQLGFSRGQTVIDTVGRNPISGEVAKGIKQTVVTAVEEK
jgi:inosine-uridine nucleoside N-ribohydrolase